jgi:hypothetical protein
MTRWKSGLLAALLAASAFASPATAANCEADRALFPKNWNATGGETPLFTCRGHYISLKVFLTERKEDSLMLTVVNDKNVYRAKLSPREADRFKKQEGLYILYSEKTCFIRGNYSSPAVLNFADDSKVNSYFNFLFAANSLDAFEGCEPVK